MNNYDRDVIENFYMIRVHEEDELLRTTKLGELEALLEQDERAKLEHVITPISTIIAFLYEPELIAELQEQGYELLQQYRTKMIE